MSDHDSCQELLPWYANGTLNETEMTLCEKHLEACDVCRGDLQGTIQQMRALNAKPIPALDAESGLQTLLARDDGAHPAQPRWHRWPVSLAAATVIAAAIVVTQVAPQPAYRLLSERTASHIHVQLAFHADTTEEEIRSFILGSGGTVAGNPSAAGVYRLRFTREVPLATLEQLRGHAVVAWASVER